MMADDETEQEEIEKLYQIAIKAILHIACHLCWRSNESIFNKVNKHVSNISNRSKEQFQKVLNQ